MTTHTFCDHCGLDLGDHTASRPYDEPCEVVIQLTEENDLTLCGNCYVAHVGEEPITDFRYTPHKLVWPEVAEVVEDFETEELIEEIETLGQLSLWQEAS